MSASSAARSGAIDVVPEEARTFQGLRAGIVSRLLACGIDAVVVVTITIGLYAAWAGLLFLRHGRSFRFPTVGLATAISVGIVVFVVYSALGWAGTGRTYGGQILGLRVVGPRGARIRPGRSLLRAMLCAAFPLGLGWCALSAQNRSVQDVLLRTSVLYDWEVGGAPTGTRGSAD